MKPLWRASAANPSLRPTAPRPKRKTKAGRRNAARAGRASCAFAADRAGHRTTKHALPMGSRWCKLPGSHVFKNSSRSTKDQGRLGSVRVPLNCDRACLQPPIPLNISNPGGQRQPTCTKAIRLQTSKHECSQRARIPLLGAIRTVAPPRS